MSEWMIVAALASLAATACLFARAALHAANFEKSQRRREGHGPE